MMIAAVAALTAAAPAKAANYNQISMAQLTAVFTSNGVAVRSVSPDVLQIGGTFVFLTDCGTQAGLCAEISFFRNYRDVRPTLAAVNEWNNKRKIPEASVNSDGTLHMEVWMSAVGATDTGIIDMFRWFESYAADTNFWGPYMTGAQS
jgi:hypothetical protein